MTRGGSNESRVDEMEVTVAWSLTLPWCETSASSAG